jgi:hypothetical protein
MYTFKGLITDGDFLTLLNSHGIASTILPYFADYFRSLCFMRGFTKTTTEKWDMHHKTFENVFSQLKRPVLNQSLLIKRFGSYKIKRFYDYLMDHEKYKFYRLEINISDIDLFLKFVRGTDTSQLAFKKICFIPPDSIYDESDKELYDEGLTNLEAYNDVCRFFIQNNIPLD